MTVSLADIPADSFSVKRAVLFARLSAIAYEREIERALKEFRKLGCRDCEYYNRDDSQAWLLEFDTFRVLVFRGTEKDMDDIRTDLRAGFHPITDNGANVHSGFLTAFHRLSNEIGSDLIAQRSFPKPLFLTGHSLGGALALLAAEFYETCGYFPTAVYSFGTPRAGNEKFVELMDHIRKVPHFRLTNNRDVVPHVPPWFAGYRHQGENWHIDSRGNLSRRPAMVWRLLTFLRGLFGGGFSDHSINNYIARLSALTEGNPDHEQ